jgi:hypothetical protein
MKQNFLVFLSDGKICRMLASHAHAAIEQCVRSGTDKAGILGVLPESWVMMPKFSCSPSPLFQMFTLGPFIVQQEK